MSSKSQSPTISSHTCTLFPDSDETVVDNAVSACSEWLARHFEQETLAKRWQRLESHLVREHRWFELSTKECAALPEATQLDAISERLDELYALNQRLLTSLPMVAATTTYGLSCKVSVVLALIHPEENKGAHRLLQSILQEVEATEAKDVSEQPSGVGLQDHS